MRLFAALALIVVAGCTSAPLPSEPAAPALPEPAIASAIEAPPPPHAAGSAAAGRYAPASPSFEGGTASAAAVAADVAALLPADRYRVSTRNPRRRARRGTARADNRRIAVGLPAVETARQNYRD
jgi:hypothetical protein